MVNKLINLVKDTIDNKDIDRLIEWLKTYPKLTKGNVTIKLEKKWSKWLGRKYSVFCNSGSSANLLMLSALKESGYMDNNKVVVPSVITLFSPLVLPALKGCTAVPPPPIVTVTVDPKSVSGVVPGVQYDSM